MAPSMMLKAVVAVALEEMSALVSFKFCVVPP